MALNLTYEQEFISTIVEPAFKDIKKDLEKYDYPLLNYQTYKRSASLWFRTNKYKFTFKVFL